jgi:mono/diheme cytochrome c family protein
MSPIIANWTKQTSPLALAAILLFPALTGCQVGGQASARSARGGSSVIAPAPAHRVERGRYLVTVIGCHDCHTPLEMTEQGPAPDMSRMLSGHPEQLRMPRPPKLPEGPWLWMGAATNTAFSGPWGVSYAVNLTPDENTGLGIWTEEMFVRALRTGRHMGVSRPILPPMPWQHLAHLTDEDLKAIYAYLRSIPPVRNRVPEALEPEEVLTAMK